MTGNATARRFNVGDALVLVAALGISLAATRDRFRTFPARTARWTDDYRRFRAELAGPVPMDVEDYRFSVKSLVFYVSDEGKAWLISILVGLTPAQVILRLRRPRPDRDILSRQPGFLGCCAAMIGLALDRGWVPHLRFGSLVFPILTALGVVIAWTLLFVLRRWRSEKSWLDRLGIAVGIGWIVAEVWSQLEQAFLW
jgi:hypothetical protein